METSLARKQSYSAADRDMAVRLGSLMLCTLSSGGGGVIRAIDESGLSFIQMKALLSIVGPEAEPATVKSLAESLDVSLASASRAVDGLVKRELATRIEDPDDRRVRRVSPTKAGQELADELFAARVAGLESFIASLSPSERRRLDAALALLLEREDIAAVYRTHRNRVHR
jgi:DNA-binding MarR family transcriptional regulator